MKPVVDVTVKGVAELKANMQACAAATDANVAEAAEKAARPVRSAAQAAVPVKSGKMRAGVTVTRMDGGAWVGYVGVPYATWVDQGGSRGRPYVAGGRYLGPAASSNEAGAVTAFETVLQPVWEKYSW